MSKQYSDQTALACDLTALNPEQRERYQHVRERLHESQQEIREVTNGYTFRYPVDDSILSLLAEFMDIEGRCCPFLNFALDVKTERGPAWLTLTGPEGVKEFLRVEMSIDKQLS
jgi:hypothetical protein